jgi:DNA-binding transcriptional MerR regulator
MNCEQPIIHPEGEAVWIESDAPHLVPTEFKLLLTISEIAEKFAVTPRALRFYESKGLIAPSRDGMVRLYGQSEVGRIALILKAKKLGFTLSEVRQMIDGPSGRSANTLKLSRDKCAQQIGILERQLQESEEALAELRRIHALLLQPAER